MIKKHKEVFLFVLPSLFGILIFFVIPIIYLIYCSLIKNTIQNKFVGFANYHQVLYNEAFRVAIKNSFLFSLLAVPLTIFFSLFFAVVLENNIPGKSVFRSFFLTPLMVPTASIILIWQIFFNYNGAVNNFLEKISIRKIDFFHWKYSILIILLLFLWKNMGYYMIIYMAALNEIPKDLIESAIIDGGSNKKVFFYIKLPYLSPTILFVGILSLCSSLKIFKEVYLLVGIYPFSTLYLIQHFMNNMFLSLNFQNLSALTIIMVIVISIIVICFFKIENIFGRDFEG